MYVGLLTRLLPAILCVFCAARAGWAQDQEQKPPSQKEEPTDPFAGIKPQVPAQKEPTRGWARRFVSENFTFKKEIYLQLTTGTGVDADPPLYIRQSAGFEMFKKFSTKTSTIAAFDLQGRLVRRDNFIEVLNDMEGVDREGFFPEYHNVYLDFYNIFNPLMGQSGRSRNLGRFNWRTGRFYLPFGINLQTDTHGTLLQLSNEENFGFERDWYTGLYGSLTRGLNYDCYYLLGSGYKPRFQGQRGMLGARLSLGNRFLNERGLEGGISVMSGERLSEPGGEPPVETTEPQDAPTVVTKALRFGLDGRYTRLLWGGTAAFTTELSGGEDKPNAVYMQLHQIEFTSRSRKWGWAGQYRRFWLDSEKFQGKADAWLIGEFTLYSKNDAAAAKLRWVKFNLARTTERREGEKSWLFTLQYYYYW
jgi:hypothetical protein